MTRSDQRLTAMALLVMIAFGTIALSAREVRADSPAEASVSNDPDVLLKLADQAGFKNLTDCERKLLESAPIGEYAVCGPNENDDDPQNDPSKSDQWPESRQIRAELIRWLCVNEATRKLIDPQGIQIYGAKVIDPLNLNFISVVFPLIVVGSRVTEPMSLMYANIDTLSLIGTWTGPIIADALVTRAGILLKGVHADGGVRLLGATLGGDLDCSNGTFSNPNPGGYALNADGIKVAGGIFLNQGFKATGEVNLVGATVGTDLDCHDGTFSNSNAMALNADGIKVAGDVFLRQGFNATGEVRLPGATIGGDLDCRDATFTSGSWLIAERARISGEFWWTRITDGSKTPKPNQKNPDVMLDMVGASAGSVADDDGSWPVAGKLFLNGFTYDHFEITTDTGALVPRDADSRLRWLRLQDSSGGLATQPYEQLAKVLESGGEEQGARQVRIAMEDDLLSSLPWYTRFWRRVLKYTVGYGYEPWLALYWAFGFVAFGYLSFALGYRAGLIGPTDQKVFSDFQDNKPLPGYQPFNAFVYSLDTFLPIINLGLKDNWMPDPNLKPRPKALEGTWLGDFVATRFQRFASWRFFNSGRALRVYFWCHLLLGWVLITLFAAGFTGIIRR